MKIEIRDIEDLGEAIAHRIVPLVEKEVRKLVKVQLKEIAYQLELFANRLDEDV